MSRGPDQPVLLEPVRCTTLELKDLADTEDFDLNGEIGQLYGFEYTDDGYYKRAEITDKKVPKLEQLRNVVGENVGQLEYKIVKKKDNKWHLIPFVDWEIKFEFISPFTFFDSNKNFRKAFNSGPLHVSLVPQKNSRREIEIKPFNKRQYLLHKKKSVIKDGATQLEFIPNIPLPDEFTMIFELSVRKDDPGPPVGVSDVMIKGILISWQNLNVESLRCTVVIQNSGEEIKVLSSSDKVILSVNPKNLTELSFINITNLDLIAFYFIEDVLSDGALEMLTGIN